MRAGFPLIALLVLFFTITTANDVVSADAPGECPQIPAKLQASVQRTLPSKPGDLFAVLQNGMTVLIRNRAESDVVSVQVFVRAGSLYEGKYLTGGLSHYLEHVLSGGSTRSFTEAEAKQRLQRMGGVTNAYTSHDRTVYYINTSAEHWRDALDLLTSYVTENTLKPAEVKREKSVIQQEYKMGENDVNRELWKLFLRTAYQVHPVRNPVIGHEEVFVNQDRNSLLSYYSERYQPENMIISVVGDVAPLDVLEFIVGKTKHVQRKAAEPVSLPQEPLQTSQRWVEEELPIARLNQVMVGFPSVTLYDQDLYALDVLAFLLGEGQTCRLYCRLKDEENQVLSVSASNWTPSFVRGQFIVSMSLAPQFWPGVLKSMDEEINRFKTELVSSEELEKAKKATIAQHVFGKETASALASTLAASFFDTGNPYFDEIYVENIRRVTPEEIRSVAQRYLNLDRATVAVVRPVRQEGSTTPAIQCEEAVKPSPISSNQLENGLRVLLKRDTSLPVVTIQLYGLGGLLLESRDQPGISAFTASLLTAGTRDRSKLDILRTIEDVGGSIDTGSENNTYHVSIRVLKEDFYLGLNILGDILKNAQFPEEEIEKKRKETLLAIQRIDENWQAEAVRLFKKNYFQNSPYRHDRLGTAESLQSFSRDDLIKFYERMVNPHHSALAVYGDVDPDQALDAIRNVLGDWSRQPIEVPSLPNEAQQIDSNRIVQKNNEKTSAALFVGTNGFDIHSAERPALDVLNGILAGTSYPGGRLFEALRGKDDLVYVVGAFPFYGKNAGYFGVISQTTLGNLDKVQRIILDNLRRLTAQPVPQKELQTAKDMIITSHRMARESLGSQARDAAVSEVLGLGWDYEERYPDLIRSVTAEDVLRVAKKLFTHTLIARTIPDHPVEVLAHPATQQNRHIQ